MQVNLNCNSPKPQFGMSMNSNEVVNKALSKRIKDVRDANRLAKAFEKAKENDLVDINLMIQPDGKSLSANIFSPSSNYYFSQHSENWFTKLTKGPIGFVEDMVIKAEKAAQKVQKQKTIEEKINKL